MKVLELAGDHYTMGRQHAAQVADLKPQIVAAMQDRLESFARDGVQRYEAELLGVWEEAARSTLDMLHGIADGLELEWAPFFRYTVASYLEKRVTVSTQAEGCTVWAAADPMTRDGTPILVKNRDYRPEHQPLQCLARAHPEHGYRYAYVTSAGSPAVFSSGMNEAGLAVADTHVVSRDVGPGVARYSVEMELLERHDTVESALAYLNEVRHLGDGTLTLIDRTGAMAVVETGHTAIGVVRPEQGFVVSTNHFTTPALRDRWVDERSLVDRNDTQQRYARVTAALEAACSEVDGTWAQSLMAAHGTAQEAICCHPDSGENSATISTVIFLPADGIFHFANGQPCQAPFRAWSVC